MAFIDINPLPTIFFLLFGKYWLSRQMWSIESIILYNLYLLISSLKNWKKIESSNSYSIEL